MPILRMIAQERKYRLRPSVSLVPTGDESIIEFFQSNTRRTVHLRVASQEYYDLIAILDGKFSLTEAIASVCADSAFVARAECFCDYLYERCILEDADLAAKVERSHVYRNINFLADYFPSHNLLECCERLAESTVMIVGCGAVGSWVAMQLAQIGIGGFVLVDTDVVSCDNLNRSLFSVKHIGAKKTIGLSCMIKDVNENARLTIVDALIDSEDTFTDIFSGNPKVHLVVNCSDDPNVDTTSSWIFRPLMDSGTSHILAGGYNLHLSLIGPTILPYKSACFECIRLGLEDAAPDNLRGVRKLARPKRNIGNVAPLAGISSSFTANEALRCLLADSRLSPYMVNKRAEYNFMTQELRCTEFKRRPDCSWCGNAVSPTKPSRR